MRKSKGFTLIELLVVVGIIALLLSILMPALNRARELGQRAVCANHLRTLTLANEVYASKYDGYYAPIMYWSSGTPTYLYKWPINMAFRACMEMDSYKTNEDKTYFNLPDAFLCPTDKISRNTLNILYNPEPEAPPEFINEQVLCSYAYNYTDWADTWKPAKIPGNSAGHRSDTVSHPSEKLAFIDSVDWWADWGGANYKKGWDELGQASIEDYKDPTKAGIDGPTIYRHNEGANLGFYDGHTEYRKKQDVFKCEEINARNPSMWWVKHCPSFPIVTPCP